MPVSVAPVHVCCASDVAPESIGKIGRSAPCADNVANVCEVGHQQITTPSQISAQCAQENFPLVFDVHH